MNVATNRRVLLVDDEARITDALERLLEDDFEITTSNDPVAALDMLAAGEFAAVVSDMRMPRVDGAELLRRARDAAPNTVRLLLTGEADLASAVAAVNEGAVFRFLLKPCPRDALFKALDAAIAQHALLTAERELLDRTLTRMVQLLTDVLAAAAPDVFSRATRLKRYVSFVTKAMAVQEGWQYEVAALLSQLGCIALPDGLVQRVFRGGTPTPSDQAAFDAHPDVAHRLLIGIPRLAGVAQIVHAQRSSVVLHDEALALGAAMLRVVGKFDKLVESGMTTSDAMASLERAAAWTPAERCVLDVLATMPDPRATQAARPVTLEAIEEGTTFAKDVVAGNGSVLVKAGTDASRVVLERLRRFATGSIGVMEPVFVIAGGGKI